MTAPDENMRVRLRAVADQEPLGSLSANERVSAEQVAEASLKLREHNGRGWLAVAAAFSLMLTGFVFWRVFEQPRQSPIAHGVHTPTAPARCDAFEGRTIEAAQLAGRATFSAVPSSVVTITLSADCDIRADLRAGSLYVHAANLHGRALQVVTAHGRVEVRGTVFAVHTTEDSSSVEVDEGHVQVFAADGRSLSLRAGQAVRIEARSLQRGPAQLPVRNRLRAAVGQAPRVVKSIERDAGPAAATESIWRAGSVPTPSVPPEPKSSVTEDGRPMRKPLLNPGE